MANMSYCRFENTSFDFADCLNKLNQLLEDEIPIENDLSGTEARYAERLYKMCVEFVETYEEITDNQEDWK